MEKMSQTKQDQTYKSLWKWLAFFPLPIILALAYFSADVTRWHFHERELPRLLASAEEHYLPKSEFVPTDTILAPKHFEYASTTRKGDTVTERYFDANGNKTLVKFTNNKWVLTHIDCQTGLTGILSLISFILYAVGIVMRGVRTGTWYYWPGANTPPFTHIESILFVYGMAIFCTTIIAPGTSCQM
jgi:hypothetical protein